jgi:hypothetical protein
MLCWKRPTSFLFRKPFLAPQIHRNHHHHQQQSIADSLFRMTSTLPRLPIFEAIASHDPESTVVIHSRSGRKFKYGELLGDVADAKDRLLREAGGASIGGQRIAFLVENSYDYVGAQNGVFSVLETTEY